MLTKYSATNFLNINYSRGKLTQPLEFGAIIDFTFVGTSRPSKTKIVTALQTYNSQLKYNFSGIITTLSNLVPINATNTDKPFSYKLYLAFEVTSGYNASSIGVYNIVMPIINNMKSFLGAYTYVIEQGFEGNYPEVSHYLDGLLPSVPSMKDVQAAIAKAQKDLDSTTSVIDAAKKEVSTANTLLAVINKDLSDLETAVQQPNADIAAMAQKYDGLKAAIATTQKELEKLATMKLDPFYIQIAKIRSQLRALNEEISILQANKGSYGSVQQLHALQAKAAGVQKELEDILSQIQVLQGEAAKTANKIQQAAPAGSSAAKPSTTVPAGGIGNTLKDFFIKYKYAIGAGILGLLLVYRR